MQASCTPSQFSTRGSNLSNASFIFVGTLVHVVSQVAYNLGPSANVFSNCFILAHVLSSDYSCILHIPPEIFLLHVETVGERHYSCSFHRIGRQPPCAQGR